EQRLELPLGSEPIAAQIFFGGGDRVGRPFISGRFSERHPAFGRIPPQQRTSRRTTSPPPRIFADSASSPCTSLDVLRVRPVPSWLGSLTKLAAEPCYPRLISELSFRMLTFSSLP